MGRLKPGATSRLGFEGSRPTTLLLGLLLEDFRVLEEKCLAETGACSSVALTGKVLGGRGQDLQRLLMLPSLKRYQAHEYREERKL